MKLIYNNEEWCYSEIINPSPTYSYTHLHAKNNNAGYGTKNVSCTYCTNNNCRYYSKQIQVLNHYIDYSACERWRIDYNEIG